MTAQELWNRCRAEGLVPDCEYEAWAFGCDADELARLVLEGKKTATASVYAVYEPEGEPLPVEGEFSVILDSGDQAVCVIRTTKVYVSPFDEVSAEHAYKEGEGDRSLAYWRKVHQEFFQEELNGVGLNFSDDMQVVCEEFEVVYKT